MEISLKDNRIYLGGRIIITVDYLSLLVSLYFSKSSVVTSFGNKKRIPC